MKCITHRSMNISKSEEKQNEWTTSITMHLNHYKPMTKKHIVCCGYTYLWLSNLEAEAWTFVSVRCHPGLHSAKQQWKKKKREAVILEVHNKRNKW